MEMLHIYNWPYNFIGMPTIEEVCSSFDLTDVDIEYTDEDCQTLTTYKLFQQHVRPILQKENPKVPMSKLMMLVAAKWREFSESNPNLQEDAREDDESPPRSPEYTPKPSRSRSSRSAAEKNDDFDDEEDDDDEPEVKSKRNKSKSICSINAFIRLLRAHSLQFICPLILNI